MIYEMEEVNGRLVTILNITKTIYKKFKNSKYLPNDVIFLLDSQKKIQKCSSA